jgi:proteasome accessory factor C
MSQNTDALSRISRLFKIVTLLSSKGASERINRAILAESCYCSVKTVQRDIAFLQQANVPVDYDSGSKSYYLHELGWTFPVYHLSVQEVLALCFVRSWLAADPNGLPFAGNIKQALTKVTSTFTPRQHQLFNKAAASVVDLYGLARDYSKAPVETVFDALLSNRTLKIDYDSRSGIGREHRMIDPYRMDRREGRFLELQAWCHKRQAVRTFALDRIHKAELTDQSFIRRPWQPDDIGSVGGIRGGEEIEVEVQFDPETAPFAIERNWGFPTNFSQEISGFALLRGVVKGRDAMIKELLRWGAHAKVLGGLELLEGMKAEVAALHNIYCPEESREL